MPPEPIRLKVRELVGSDQYKDMVRVHWRERNKMANGKITRVLVDGRGPYFLAMRGTNDDQLGTIGLDHLNRDYMELRNGQEASFTFERANWWQALKWAANSADPAGRIATWIAIWSGLIGIAGLILSILPLTPWFSQTSPPLPSAAKEQPVVEKKEPGKKK